MKSDTKGILINIIPLYEEYIIGFVYYKEQGIRHIKRPFP
ncbi:hypothetical protein BCE_1208 [Bacillus cereus ATCC 10987]|uniref:Uncharacterized protein n=1 Tax=Bacillus cereus (strain ATCC 10987 / NRS 248) TaxID=222523 RepID=Q73C59_BACC1|nr:hypothetical protein BCE_1208 [Bacillus cereus ATCC 10987]